MEAGGVLALLAVASTGAEAVRLNEASSHRASVVATLQIKAADQKLGCDLVESFPGTWETLGLIPRAEF